MRSVLMNCYAEIGSVAIKSIGGHKTRTVYKRTSQMARSKPRGLIFWVRIHGVVNQLRNLANGFFLFRNIVSLGHYPQ